MSEKSSTSAILDLPSAKTVSVEQLVQLFVPTRRYWRLLLSPSHYMLLGTRGSGKTILLRMLSVDHLRRLAQRDSRAAAALSERQMFGVYLALSVDWCVGLTGESAESSDRVFTDGVNMVAAQAFLSELEEAIEVCAEVGLISSQHAAEKEIVGQLCETWFQEMDRRVWSLAALRRVLRRQENLYKDAILTRRGNQDQALRDRGFCFLRSSLFGPLQQGASIANEVLGLERGHGWIIALDELEALTKDQQTLLMTVLRGSHNPLVFKMATLPYTFTETATRFSSFARGAENREFRVERLQYDPGDREYQVLVANIGCHHFDRPAEDGAIGAMEELFGRDTIVARARAALENRARASGAKDRVRQGDIDLLEGGLAGDSARKLGPVAAIRVLKDIKRGHSRSCAYSGWEFLVRASDGNPSLFVRLMYEVERRISAGGDTVAPEDQHDAIVSQAEHLFHSTRALYPDGSALEQLIDLIGRSLSSAIHDVPSDRPEEEGNRFLVDLTRLTDVEREAFHWGARHSLLVGETPSSADRGYPIAEGVWRLGYALSPKFWLLPRRGRVRGVYARGSLHLSSLREAGQGLLWEIGYPGNSEGRKQSDSQLATPGFDFDDGQDEMEEL